jgi:hypothetical protein
MAGAGTMSRLGGCSPEGERLRHAGKKAILEELEGINKIFKKEEISLSSA